MGQIFTAPAGLVELRAGIEQFYARHFHLLDDGKAAEWAGDFTEDGAFFPPNAPEPLRGRGTLVAGVERAHAEYQEKGEQRRHWHGMIAVQPREDGTILVRCYAQIIITPRGGQARLHLSCVCEDVFVVEGGALLIRERRVSRDDLG
ncbi:nuclear transport factor 2 family protein [Kitasatospora sp. NPDC101235]|uniref:nuclear transport factor 2 family protein n=1 Tax=Kitasatospora sp. NPDC101235 TaxID=3364101 RepID=UPI00380FF04E